MIAAARDDEAEAWISTGIPTTPQTSARRNGGLRCTESQLP